MKIAITGGHSEAEFIISMFMKEKHQLVIINDDMEMAKKISQDNGLNVYYGDPTRPHILEDAGIKGSDILISLSDVDTDNYVICMLAKKVFNVKKCICIVKNPKNVDIFKKFFSKFRFPRHISEKILKASFIIRLFKKSPQHIAAGF